MKCSKKWSLLFIKQPHLTNEKRERIKIYFAFSGGIPYQHNQADEVKLYITDDHQAITIKGVEELKKKKANLKREQSKCECLLKINKLVFMESHIMWSRDKVSLCILKRVGLSYVMLGKSIKLWKK